MTGRIQALHGQSRGTYGAPRIHADLRAAGVRCGRTRVARLMRGAGLVGCHRRRFVTTTQRASTAPAMPDRVQRQFAAGAPNALVDAYADGTLHYRVYPNATIGVILLALVPLVDPFSVGVNVLVSSRANEVRTAHQLGAVIPALPLGSIYVLTEVGVITLSVPTLWSIAAVLAVLDVVTVYATLRTFRRDQILTAWT